MHVLDVVAHLATLLLLFKPYLQQLLSLLRMRAGQVHLTTRRTSLLAANVVQDQQVLTESISRC